MRERITARRRLLWWPWFSLHYVSPSLDFYWHSGLCLTSPFNFYKQLYVCSLSSIMSILSSRFHKQGAYNVENEEKVKLGAAPHH